MNLLVHGWSSSMQERYKYQSRDDCRKFLSSSAAANVVNIVLWQWQQQYLRNYAKVGRLERGAGEDMKWNSDFVLPRQTIQRGKSTTLQNIQQLIKSETIKQSFLLHFSLTDDGQSGTTFALSTAISCMLKINTDPTTTIRTVQPSPPPWHVLVHLPSGRLPSASSSTYSSSSSPMNHQSFRPHRLKFQNS